MAHFAQIEDNIVSQVIVVDNEDCLDAEGNESEEVGAQFCTNLLGGNWKQTSYNSLGGVHLLEGTAFRKNYAGIGFAYDETRDAFIEPKPYPSWILNEDSCVWKSPVAYPNDDKKYKWNEDITNWEELD